MNREDNVLKRKFGLTGILFVSILGLASLFSSSALAAGPPIVTVGAASNFTLNTATANGTVNNNGAVSTSVKLEYGKTKLYGKSITLSNVTGSSAVPVSSIISGLEAVTTYHYRISATNSYGTTLSGDMPFEMLLQWKVAGKPVSEYTKPVKIAAKFNAWTFTGEGTSPGGTAVKITCEPSHFLGEGWGEGTLGVSLHLPYLGCKTFLNGSENKPCKPTLTAIDLNSVLLSSVQTLALSEECSIGESLPLPSYYRLGAMAEAVEQGFTFSEQAGYMTYTIANPTWKVVGELEGFKFGIS
jgi:hypothetical protein